MPLKLSFLIIVMILIAQIGIVVNALEPLWVKELSNIGIDPCYEPITPVKTFTYEVNEITYNDEGDYISIDVNPSKGLLMVPGKPILPIYTYRLIVPAELDDVKVSVINVKYEINYVPKPMKILDKLYTYMILKSNKTCVKVPINITNGFYPGKLISWYKGTGAKGTYIYVKIYPINYDYKTSRVAIVKKITIGVSYRIIKPLKPLETPVIAIITSKYLSTQASKLAEIYLSRGYSVKIAYVEDIALIETPAEEITEYPGFYNPIYVDKYYEELLKKYDWKLALKIISWLRDHKYITHVIILGGSHIVPPSFYYQSIYNYWYVDPWNSWIPTDFFYASPDYDLIPNFHISRIPLSDPADIDEYLSKLEGWYYISKISSEWHNNMILVGGCPFRLAQMFGEAYISSITQWGWLTGAQVSFLQRTLNNYTLGNVYSLLHKGGFGWLAIICHGSGNAFVDSWINITEPGTVTVYIEQLPGEALLRLKYVNKLPVIASVACMNACWDEEILAPPPIYFAPPSFGKYVLLSPGAGIAYIGASRVAWECLNFIYKEGVQYALSFCASSLIMRILKMYCAAEKTITLGEAFSYALEEWLEEQEYYNDLTYLTLMEFTILGDAVLPLKPPESKEGLSPKIAWLTSPKVWIDVMGVYLFGEGYVPLYGVNKIINVNITGLKGIEGSKLMVIPVKIWHSYSMLYGFSIGAEGDVKVTNGQAPMNIIPSKSTSGLLIINIIGKGVNIRLQPLIIGVKIRQEELKEGDRIKVGIYGIGEVFRDLLTVYMEGMLVYVEPIEFFKAIYPGYVEFPLLLPLNVYGELMLYARSTGATYLYERLSNYVVNEVLSAKIRVYKTTGFSVKVVAPQEVYINTSFNVTVYTFLNDRLCDSEIDVEVYGNGEV
ncbi:MAG: hypothetical protein DRO40_12565, partial [Thermoprotei archaeon]